MRKREDEYTLLKVIATVLVVLGHVIIFYSRDGGVIPMEPDTILHYLMKIIYSFHMPLFIFLSGAIFKRCIALGKYKNIGMFIRKKFSRLMIPYFVWGCFYITPVMLLLGLTESSIFEYIGLGIFCNKDSRHLWFLWALFLIFVIARFLVPLMEKNRLLPVLITIPTILVSYYAWSFPGIFGINSTLRYLQYFLCGYIFEENKDWIDEFLDGKWFLPILSGVLLIIAVLLTNNYNVNFLLPYFGIFTCYCIAKIVCANANLAKNPLYRLIKQNSMGIYLSHPMIIYLQFYFIDKTGIPILNKMLASALIFLITCILSLFLTRLLKKLNLHIILGEN